MIRKITSYFILILYLAFSVGIVIEYHNHCTFCDDGKCNISLSHNDEDCNCHSENCEVEKHHSNHNCNCSIKEYKIIGDYVNEENKKEILVFVVSINFINTFLKNDISNINKDKFLSFFKLPDKRLFYKFTIYELSSILC